MKGLVRLLTSYIEQKASLLHLFFGEVRLRVNGQSSQVFGQSLWHDCNLFFVIQRAGLDMHLSL